MSEAGMVTIVCALLVALAPALLARATLKEVKVVAKGVNGSLEKLNAEIEVIRARNATLERLLQMAIQLKDREG